MRRLLIVEDDESIQSLLKSIVSKVGYEPLVTDSVKDALEILKTDKNIDTIIVDMQLTDGWGVNLINRIRIMLTLPNIKIIVYSGNIDIFERWKDKGVEVDAVIKKNGSIDPIRNAISCMWRCEPNLVP